MSHEGIRTVVNVFYRYFVSYTKHFEISSALRCRNLIICYTFECEDIKIHIPCLLSTENTRIENIDHVFVQDAMRKSAFNFMYYGASLQKYICEKYITRWDRF